MKKLPPKTKKEAAQRLIDGERFSVEDGAVYFNEENCDSPFMFNEDRLSGCWNDFKDWQPIQEWHETVSPENPRLCWVRKKDIAVLICDKESDYFIGFDGCTYAYATPVTPEDLTGA